MENNKINWLTSKKKSLLKTLRGVVTSELDLNKVVEELKYKEDKNVLLNTVKNLELYYHPLELKLRNRYLEIVQQHGNGLWAIDTLEWEVYNKYKEQYEALNEDEKYIVNLFMKTLACLYK